MAKTKKLKQKQLPGMVNPKIPDIDRLADRYCDARDEWQALHKPMMDAQDLLYAAMKTRNLRHYEMEDGRIVDVLAIDKVRVKKPKHEENGDGNE